MGDQVGEASKPNTASRDGPRHAADDGGVDEPAVLIALHSRMHLHMEEFSLTQVVEKVVEQVLVERLAHTRVRCAVRVEGIGSRETDLCTGMRAQESFCLAHQEASSSCHRHRVTSSASSSSCSCSFPAIVIALVAGELR